MSKARLTGPSTTRPCPKPRRGGPREDESALDPPDPAASKVPPGDAMARAGAMGNDDQAPAFLLGQGTWRLGDGLRNLVEGIHEMATMERVSRGAPTSLPAPKHLIPLIPRTQEAFP